MGDGQVWQHTLHFHLSEYLHLLLIWKNIFPCSFSKAKAYIENKRIWLLFAASQQHLLLSRGTEDAAGNISAVFFFKKRVCRDFPHSSANNGRSRTWTGGAWQAEQWQEVHRCANHRVPLNTCRIVTQQESVSSAQGPGALLYSSAVWNQCQVNKRVYVQAYANRTFGFPPHCSWGLPAHIELISVSYEAWDVSCGSFVSFFFFLWKAWTHWKEKGASGREAWIGCSPCRLRDWSGLEGVWGAMATINCQVIGPEGPGSEATLGWKASDAKGNDCGDELWHQGLPEKDVWRTTEGFLRARVVLVGIPVPPHWLYSHRGGWHSGRNLAFSQAKKKKKKSHSSPTCLG